MTPFHKFLCVACIELKPLLKLLIIMLSSSLKLIQRYWRLVGQFVYSLGKMSGFRKFPNYTNSL